MRLARRLFSGHADVASFRPLTQAVYAPKLNRPLLLAVLQRCAHARLPSTSKHTRPVALGKSILAFGVRVTHSLSHIVYTIARWTGGSCVAVCAQMRFGGRVGKASGVLAYDGG